MNNHPDNPSMGMNLNGLSTYGNGFQTLNLLKGGDGWTALNFNGGFNETTDLDPSYFDAAGWPTRMPEGDLADDIWLTRVSYSEALPAGRYVIRWEGEGEITVEGTVVAQTDNQITFDVAENSGGDGRNAIQFYIDDTDPNATGNYIRDIEVFREEDTALVDAGQIWRPEYLDQIGDFRVIRPMDMLDTNSSSVTDWDPTGEKAFWHDGTPVQEVVALANEINADLWFNIPHLATDAYVRDVAAYIRDTLDPELTVRVEYSNEHWTRGFSQRDWFQEQGEALLGTGTANAREQFYALRAHETISIFKDVFDHADRVQGVITHTAGFGTAPEVTNALFEAPDLVALGLTPPSQSAAFDIVAVDTYYDGGIAFGENAAIVRNWFNTLPEQEARDRAFEAMMTGAGLNNPYSFEELAANYATYRAIADQNGWALESYEGGSFLITEQGEFSPYTDFIMSLNRDPRIVAFQDRIFDTWIAAGGELIAHYADSGYDGYFGNWATWDTGFATEPNVRGEGVVALNATAPWYTTDGRDPSIYLDDRYREDAPEVPPLNQIEGTGRRDVLTGTAAGDEITAKGGNDRVDGAAGDDLLRGGQGRDRLLGADGNDTLLGGAGNDALSGQDGDDRMNGGAGSDRIWGGAGDDIASGKRGNDAITGNDGNDLLRGGKGRDTLHGGTGDDQLNGGNGADLLQGGGGADTLKGGAGADRLEGQWGDDLLKGGTGADVFVFGLNHGADVIADFTQGSDTIDLSALGLAGFDGLSTALSQDPDGQAVLRFEAEQSAITLLNVSASSLTAEDFIL